MVEITLARKTAAYKIHMDIMAAGEVASEAFSTFCRLLKTMRDDKLYQELEYSSFEAYCENAVGMKYRTAFQYIRAIEVHGETDLHARAGLGIRKLELLGTVPEESREQFIDENKLQEMTTRQVEAAVKEYKSKLDAELNEVRDKFNHANFDKLKLETELKKNQEHIEKTNKYANEHMMGRRQAEKTIEDQKKYIDKLKLDINYANQQVEQAKRNGDPSKVRELGEKISGYQQEIDNYQEEIGKLNKQLQEKNQQLKEQPIEVSAARVVEKVVIPDEVRLAIYNKVVGLYEGLLKLTPTEIQMFAEDVDPDYADDVRNGLKQASMVLKELDNTVFEAQEEQEPAAKSSSSNASCGACLHADMDGVTEEQLDKCLTLCTVSEQVVDFDHSCNKFKHMREGR